MSANPPSARNIALFRALKPQIEALFDGWGFRINSEVVASKYVVESVNILLEKARIVLSRETSGAFVRPFDPAVPVSSSDIVYALCHTHTALLEFAKRHDLEDEDEPF